MNHQIVFFLSSSPFYLSMERLCFEISVGSGSVEGLSATYYTCEEKFRVSYLRAKEGSPRELKGLMKSCC